MIRSEYKKMKQLQDNFWWYQAKRKFLYYFLNKHVNKCPTSLVVDVGCGTGANIEVLSQFGQVTGIDISPAALQLLSPLGYSQIQLGTAHHLPFTNSSVDLICFLDVLYHRKVEPTIALQEAYRVLKTNGYLIITDCSGTQTLSMHDKKNHARQRFKLFELINEVETCNLKVVEYNHIFFLTFPLFLFSRFFQTLIANEDSEMFLSPFFNSFLLTLTKIEMYLIKMGIKMPIGSSLIAIARKD